MHQGQPQSRHTPHGGSELFREHVAHVPARGRGPAGGYPRAFSGDVPSNWQPCKGGLAQAERYTALYVCTCELRPRLGGAHIQSAPRRGARWRGAGRWRGGARPLTVARGRAGAARRRRRRTGVWTEAIENAGNFIYAQYVIRIGRTTWSGPSTAFWPQLTVRV